MTYTAAQNVIGVPDISTVVVSGAIGDPTQIGELPSAITEAKLGARVRAIDLANNWEGEFIFLAIPASTALSAGILVQWDKNFTVVTVPAGSTSKNTGVAVAACFNAITSNAAIQYSWFQIQGIATVLKTAVTVSPQSAVYISATAGRVKVLSSAGQTILGARTQNTATVTSTTSSVLVYLNYSAIEGA